MNSSITSEVLYELNKQNLESQLKELTELRI